MKYDVEVYIRHRYTVEADNVDQAIDESLSGRATAMASKIVGVYAKDETQRKMKAHILENVQKNKVQ